MQDKNEIPVPARDILDTPGNEGENVSEANRQAEQREKLHRRHMRALKDLLVRLGLLLLVVYILFFHLVGLTVMPGGDMSPRIDARDLVMYYRLDKDARAQDVIVFVKPTAALDAAFRDNVPVQAPPRNDRGWWRKTLDFLGFADKDMSLFVCRVVAAPGDTVEITDGHLKVNGNAMVEPNIFYPMTEYAGFVEYPLTLGDGQYFVLADHRTDGKDSRFFGIVEKEEILGTVITVVRRNNL